MCIEFVIQLQETKECACWDRKKHDSQRRDRILRFFSPSENRAILSTFWGDYTENLQEQEKIHWRKLKKPSGDGAPKLQISGPCVVVERDLNVSFPVGMVNALDGRCQSCVSWSEEEDGQMRKCRAREETLISSLQTRCALVSCHSPRLSYWVASFSPNLCLDLQIRQHQASRFAPPLGQACSMKLEQTTRSSVRPSSLRTAK